MSKQFSSISDLFDYCEEINFRSIQVLDDSGNALVNGSNTKNPWGNNKAEVERFLQKADKSYNLKIRKSPKSASQDIIFVPEKETGKPLASGGSDNGKVNMFEYTKILREKFEAISRAQIAEAENLVLKEQLAKFNADLGNDEDEEEGEAIIVETLADKAVSIYRANEGSIQPIIAALAEKAVSFLSGTGTNQSDQATAATFQMVIDKMQGKQLNEMQIEILKGNFAKLGTETQKIVAQIFN